MASHISAQRDRLHATHVLTEAVACRRNAWKIERRRIEDATAKAKEAASPPLPSSNAPPSKVESPYGEWDDDDGYEAE